MEDIFISMIGMVVGISLSFIVPSYTIADKNDDMDQLSVQTVTSQFLDQIMRLGKITEKDDNQSLIGNIDMSEKEIEAFNYRYTKYEGENIKGPRVNALINEVFSNNINYSDDKTKQITLNIDGTDVILPMTNGATAVESPKKVPTGNNYKVLLAYGQSTKLVNTITVTKN